MFLPHLFSPLKVGGLEIRNRILMTGAATNMAYGGVPGEQFADYYAERARGGAGLIVTEMTVVHPSGIVMSRAVQNWDDRIVSGLAPVAAKVHHFGGRIFAQGGHPGRQGRSWFSERPLIAPSALPSSAHNEVPKEAEEADIDELIRACAAGAARAIDAGMDGVEIHSAYGGYFLAQWLSPSSNIREDHYGGDLDRRLRIVIEIIKAVRAAIGNQVPLGIQISGEEGIPGGLTLDDSIAIAKRLDVLRRLDYITVKAGSWAVKELIAPDMQFPHGLWVEHAARIKAAVEHCLVFTVGRITDPQHAERILAGGHADMVGMTRAQMADPELATKARDGRFEDIRTCIGSNEGCQDAMFRGRYLTCTVNPAVGRERKWGIGSLATTPRPRKLLIVGGGPAGLKAAEIAARRGHEVHLWDRESALGGQVRIFSRVPMRAEYAGATEHLERQVIKLGVNISLNTIATATDVLRFNADAVVLACGSLPGKDGIRHLRADLHPIRGLESPNVIDPGAAITNSGDAARVLLVDDGENSWKLIATAICLAERGKHVEILTPHGSVGTGNRANVIGTCLEAYFCARHRHPHIFWYVRRRFCSCRSLSRCHRQHREIRPIRSRRNCIPQPC